MKKGVEGAGRCDGYGAASSEILLISQRRFAQPRKRFGRRELIPWIPARWMYVPTYERTIRTYVPATPDFLLLLLRSPPSKHVQDTPLTRIRESNAIQPLPDAKVRRAHYGRNINTLFVRVEARPADRSHSFALFVPALFSFRVSLVLNHGWRMKQRAREREA